MRNQPGAPIQPPLTARTWPWMIPHKFFPLFPTAKQHLDVASQQHPWVFGCEGDLQDLWGIPKITRLR